MNLDELLKKAADDMISNKKSMCVLTKVSGGDNVRDDVIEGRTDCFPEVGKTFNMVAKSKNPNGLYRFVETSGIIEINQSVSRDGQDIIKFTTRYGSKYIAVINKDPIEIEKKLQVDLGGY